MSTSGAPLKEMTLFEHLAELRRRLIVSSIAVVIGTVIAYAFSDQTFSLLTEIFYKNFTEGTLIGTGPAEALVLKIKVALFAGVVIVSPILFFQVWLFLSPGLYESEKRWAVPFVILTTALFLTGVFFCYTVILPLTFGLFSEEYHSINVKPTVRISEHLSMMMQALIGFGLITELPVLMFFLGRFRLITHRTLIDWSRYAVIVIFIVSAILTPPDALTQVLMAGPLLLLYGISIIIVKFTAPSAPATDSEQATGAQLPPPKSET